MTLGELLKKYREENGLSLRDFAKKSGISNSYLSMLETGRKPSTGRPIVPTLTKLNQIADGMGLRIDDLILMIDDTPVNLNKENGLELSLQEKQIINSFRNADEKTRRLGTYALLIDQIKEPQELEKTRKDSKNSKNDKK
jgi:transcriptional regulator with XRE-family HTH domain